MIVKKKSSPYQIFLLNDQLCLAVTAKLHHSHLSYATVASKSQTRCSLISVHKPLSGFFIALAETGLVSLKPPISWFL